MSLVSLVPAEVVSQSTRHYGAPGSLEVPHLSGSVSLGVVPTSVVSAQWQRLTVLACYETGSP